MPDSFHSSSFTKEILRAPAVLDRMLRGYALFRGFSDEDMVSLVEASRVASRPRGEVLVREGEGMERMFVLLRGRVEIGAVLPKGTVRTLGEIGPGDSLGELGLLTGGKSPTRATATTDVVVLEIERAHFERLFRRVPTFTENLFRGLGDRLASTQASRSRRPLPVVIGVACASPRARALLEALSRGLEGRGASYAMVAIDGFGDGVAPPEVTERLSLLPGNSDDTAIAQRIAELRATRDLVLIALEPGLEDRPSDPRLVSCEELWWTLDPAEGAAGLAAVVRLLERRRTLQGRTRLVWCLREGERPPRGERPEPRSELLQPELRAFLPEHGPPSSRRETLSIRRLIGVLEGLRVGLALGGGGSRGFAHCGVLRVLDAEGIAIDRIAGTSMGALVGMMYAAGTPPDQIVEEVAREAKTPLALRWLPQANFVNFWLKARRGSFERSLRTAYRDLRFEELDLPVQAVTADLVHGECVVRAQGDCIDAVIESINLPIFSRPILRDGRALVDGGLLNNLPTDLLLAQQIEAVIGVNVLPGGNAAGSAEPSADARRSAGLLESLLRIAELQHERLTAHGAVHADLLLRVDVGGHAMTDFSPGPARRIAAAGEDAVRQALESLRALIPARWRGRE